MPDKRKHRGANPKDAELFDTKNMPILRLAAADYSMLLSKDYPQPASLKLVGDKFKLKDRQRLALMRSCCSQIQAAQRKSREVPPDEVAGSEILIDGYNILITIEAALSSSFIFIGMDGCFRDLAGLHGTYRKVSETIPAIRLIDDCLAELKVSQITWFLDKPVSNSGKLKKIIEQQTNAKAVLLDSPDKHLKISGKITASSDSIILDNCKKWLNLARYVIVNKQLPAKLIDLSKYD